MTIGETVAQAVIATGGSQLVILSGGEPLAQVPPREQTADPTATVSVDPVGELVRSLYIRDIATQVETAGVRMPSPALHHFVDRYVVSPKLATSGNSMKARRVSEVLEFFANTRKADFKFVVTEPQDFSEIQFLANAHNIPPWRIWVMPEGTTSEAIQRKFLMVAEGALKRGYNVSGRMHVDIWGDKRGH